jgi:hypothetical protein
MLRGENQDVNSHQTCYVTFFAKVDYSVISMLRGRLCNYVSFKILDFMAKTRCYIKC